MRFNSIIQDDTEYCFFCGRIATDWHHIFNAANKKRSEEYGLMLHLCRECHSKAHGGVYDGKDEDFTKLSMLKVKKLGQKKAMEYHGLTEDEFREIFGKNYL